MKHNRSGSRDPITSISASIVLLQVLVAGKGCYGLMHSNVRNIFGGDHVFRTSLKSKDAWSTGENWSILSSEAEDASSSWSAMTAVNQDQQLLSDPMRIAARILEAGAEPKTGEETSSDDAETIGIILTSPDETDAFLSSSSTSSNYDSASEQEAKEIGFLIRCNETPDKLLVEEGRGLQPLTNDEKFDVAQLLVMDDVTATPFFNGAILNIFQQHSTLDIKSGMTVLNRDGVAKWMTTCLKDESVSKNDKRVLEGYLMEQGFLQLYKDVLQVDFESGKFKRPSSRRISSVEKIWRDFEAHGIQSPNEIEWNRKQSELTVGVSQTATTQTKKPKNYQLLHDECEILELNEDNATPHWSIDSQGVTKSRRGSHIKVDLCSDGETPKRIRDGQFVFIDEESCIGCSQCVHASPSSFMMLDTGRARTFHQSNTPDVVSAVSVCPVNCMKFISFQELKELETVRDKGGGDDVAIRLTPLYVSGIDSDANHKSSFYHTLKLKCSTSSNCPQKGCYDCPKYSTLGGNPYFKKSQVKAHATRVTELMESDELNSLRKTAEL